MSFLSSPSRTRGHPLPPLRREVSSQPPPGAVAAVQAALQAGEPVGSPMSPMGDKPARRRELAQALRQEDVPGAGRQDCQMAMLVRCTCPVSVRGSHYRTRRSTALRARWPAGTPSRKTSPLNSPVTGG